MRWSGKVKHTWLMCSRQYAILRAPLARTFSMTVLYFPILRHDLKLTSGINSLKLLPNSPNSTRGTVRVWFFRWPRVWQDPSNMAEMIPFLYCHICFWAQGASNSERVKDIWTWKSPNRSIHFSIHKWIMTSIAPQLIGTALCDLEGQEILTNLIGCRHKLLLQEMIHHNYR